MPNPQSPGIYSQENRSGIPTISGSATSVGGFAGRASRGRPSESIQVVSEVDYVAKFGATEGPLRSANRNFFNEGGSRARNVRIEHYTDLTSKATLAGTAATAVLANSTPTTTLTYRVLWPGSEGNLFQLVVTRRSTPVAELAVATTAITGTSVTLVDSRRVRVGDQLLIGTMRVIVTRIINNTVYFPSRTLTVNAQGVAVNSEMFDVDITEGGTFVARGRELRMSPLAGRNYVGNVFADEDVLSTFAVTNAALTASDAVDPRPAAATTVFSGGVDGGSIVDADFIGSKAGKTGLYAIRETDINMISIPGEATAAISRGLLQFVSDYKTVCAILDTPENVTTDTAAVTYVQTTANLSHDNAVMYYPWIYVNDPTTGLRALSSPVGFMQGIWARVDRERNIAKAPAGVDCPLLTALGVAQKIEEKSAEADTLYAARINPIIVAPEGFLPWGSRTLGASDELGQISSRRVMNMVKRSVEADTRWLVFEDNTPSTRGKWSRSVSSYLLGLWKQNILAETIEAQDAFYVISDESNNSEVDIENGFFFGTIGLKFRRTIEFAIYQFERDLRALRSELDAQGLL